MVKKEKFKWLHSKKSLLLLTLVSINVRRFFLNKKFIKKCLIVSYVIIVLLIIFIIFILLPFLWHFIYNIYFNMNYFKDLI